MMSTNPPTNPANQPAALVFSCSGAADTGELADRASRRLTAGGVARMTCLASISSGLSSTLAKAAAASGLLVIDGCPNDCAKKSLGLAGFTNFKQMRVTDLGFKKGETPVSYETIGVVAAAAVLALKTPN